MGSCLEARDCFLIDSNRMTVYSQVITPGTSDALHAAGASQQRGIDGCRVCHKVGLSACKPSLFTITLESRLRSAGIRVHDGVETAITMSRNMQSGTMRMRIEIPTSSAGLTPVFGLRGRLTNWLGVGIVLQLLSPVVQ